MRYNRHVSESPEIKGQPQVPMSVRLDARGPNKSVVVKQTFLYGDGKHGPREVILKASEGAAGSIKVEFMGQTFVLPDADYVDFFPGALQKAIDALKR